MEFRVILARPRNPDNIGAAARAMANFGLTELALVNAFANDWGEAVRTWRAEASVSAIGAMDVVNAARLCTSVPEAAEGCDLLLGTSSLHFLNPERDVVLLKDAAAFAAGRGAEKVALLFGAEKTGLTREELSYCSAVVNIQTLPNQPSMNLGQAVAVACYELSGRARPEPRAARKAAPPAPPAELARVADLISAKLCREGAEHWAGSAQLREIRQALLDARLTKGAMTALKLLLKEK
ncbi:MAG: RNA methyltransferase [Elusimicrobiales bacterium]|nr:RNA methyltransferase [Elusimicrobiales bacterium]